MKKFISLLVIFCQIVFIPYSAYAYIFDDWDENAESETIMGSVYMDYEFLDSNILKISTIAKDMQTPVLGIAFHLNYEGEKLAFLRYDPGNFLETAGDPFYLVQNDDRSGKIIFGETLRRDDSFPVGGDTIADFYFQILDSEEFNFEFEHSVISTLDVIRQDIDNVIWEPLFVSKFSEIANGVSTKQPSASNKLDSVLSIRLSTVLLLASLIFTPLLVTVIVLLIKKKHKAAYHNERMTS